MSISNERGLTQNLDFLLWEKMFYFREIELEISRRYSEGKMRCPTHLSVGQELVPAIISLIRQKTDYGVSTHRGHLHYLSFGCSLNKMIAEIYGKSTGCSNGVGGSMHLADKSLGFMGTSAIVGNSIPVGAGLALHAKIDHADSVTFIFLGDGATEEGVFYETVNFCEVKNLNVMFVCENNLYSVYSGFKDRRPDNFSLAESVKPFGLHVEKVAFGDIDDCFDKMKAAYNLAKSGRTSFIEVDTYRYLEHCGPNDDNEAGYRSMSEVESFQSNDPLSTLGKKLMSIDGYSSIMDESQNRTKALVKEAFEFAEASPYPNLNE